GPLPHTVVIAIVAERQHTVRCRLSQAAPSNRHAERERRRIREFGIFFARVTYPRLTLSTRKRDDLTAAGTAIEDHAGMRLMLNRRQFRHWTLIRLPEGMRLRQRQRYEKL